LDLHELKYLYLVAKCDGARVNDLSVYAEIFVTPSAQYAQHDNVARVVVWGRGGRMAPFGAAPYA